MSATSWAVSKGALGFLGENSLLVIGLLGGLSSPTLWDVSPVTAVEQARHRTTAPATHASGSRRGPGRGPTGPRISVRITLDQIRTTLAVGRTVLMQLGYEIVPSRREEFLGLIREMHEMLNDVDDQVYSAWEDPDIRTDSMRSSCATGWRPWTF